VKHPKNEQHHEITEEKDFGTLANTTSTSSNKGGMIFPVINHASSGYEGANA